MSKQLINYIFSDYLERNGRQERNKVYEEMSENGSSPEEIRKRLGIEKVGNLDGSLFPKCPHCSPLRF